MRYGVRYQKGHAAILFAMIVPVLLGVFNLGSEGARAMQQKARLNDALEVAALSISAHDDNNTPSQGMGNDHGSNVNRQIAADVISAYFPNLGIRSPSDLTNLKIVRTVCNTPAACGGSKNVYSQYDVTASLEYKTWFTGNKSVMGFSDKIALSSSSTSQRMDSPPTDIMLVTDFSGSMNEEIGDDDVSRSTRLKEIIKNISVRLGAYNAKSSSAKFNLGIATYNQFAHRKVSTAHCPEGSKGASTANIQHVVFKTKIENGKEVLDNAVDYHLTETNIWNINYDNDDVCTYDSPYRNYDMHNIPLTEELGAGSSLVTQLNGFIASGYTASYQGIIDGYKLLKRDGKNKKRLIIVLSDGQDLRYTGPTPYDGEQSVPHKKEEMDKNGKWIVRDVKPSFAEISTELYFNREICAQMKQKMKNPADGSEGSDLTFYLIGFGYKVGETNKALDKCVDETYYAQNMAEVEKKLFSILTEEIGHLK